MKQLILIITALLCTLPVAAQPLTPDAVYNPRAHCATCWVSDAYHILSDHTRHHIDARLDTLNTTLGVQIAIAIVPSIQGDDEYDFAHRLFNHWGIGRRGYNDGLLLLYVTDLRAMKFETGYALEGILPDAYLDDLLHNHIFPLMRTGHVDQAFLLATDHITRRLTTDQAREELLLNTATPRITTIHYLSWYLTIAFLILIIAALTLYHTTTRLHGDNNIRYAALTHPYICIGILAIIFPIPLLPLWLYTRSLRLSQRHRPLRCDHCGGTMRLLTEDEEDTHLTPGQQTEERIKSIDYDVWQCRVCHHTRILPYTQTDSRYTTCPRCGARTYTLISDDIITPATTLTPGQGQKVHICANCGLRHTHPYTIPIILIPRTTSSGSSIGGSFGGGISGGGGAGGRF